MKKSLIPFVIAALMAAALPAAAEDSAPQAPKTAPKLAPPAPAPAPAASKGPDVEDVYSDLEIFANALTIIDTHYVEKTKPKEVIRGSLKGMLSSLDPYSQFLDPDDYGEIKVETEGRFGGIGVEITFKDGVLTVISPVDGTPAAEAGIQPGDKVVKIDGKSTRDMTLEDSVKLLRGKPGTVVTLTMLREGEGRLIDLSMKRAIIKVKSIKEAEIMADKIGYIRISEFQENTSRDLHTALESLEKQGMKGLILDLRNNPGGLLSVSIDVAQEFVPKDQLIVYTKGRTADQEMRFMSKGVSEPRKYPIVVLINHGSASASEIVAGALKDHRLAILIGAQTFGKGSVQTVIPMRDGSAIRLTTAKYYTPSGVVIHGVGIKPDIEVAYKRLDVPPSKDDKKKKEVSQIFDKVEKISKPAADEEEPEEAPDDEKAGESKESKDKKADPKESDNQIQRAMDLIRALNVFGLTTYESIKPLEPKTEPEPAA